MNLKIRIRDYILKKIAQRNYIDIITPDKIKKILIVREGGIGDAISIYPMLREIKKNYPTCEIDIYAGLVNSFMYKYTPSYVNNIFIKYKKRQWYKTFIEIFKMRQKNYDLLIELTQLQLSRTLACVLINPKLAIGVCGTAKNYTYNRNSLSFFQKVYDRNSNQHILKSYLDILEYLNINSVDSSLEFFLPAKPSDNLVKYKNNKNTLLKIGFNTDGSHKDKTLCYQQIIDICNILTHKDIEIILFCAPPKRDSFKKLIKENNLNNTTLIYETKSIYEAAELVQEMDLMITPNTSFVHIASGLKIPVLGLFGNDPSHLIVWPPYEVPYETVTPKEENMLSLKTIDIKEVQQKAFKILNIK